MLQIVEGLSRSLPRMPPEVHVERNAMARQLIVHMFAERERALAAGDPTPHADWDAMAASLIDAITGLMSGTRHTKDERDEAPMKVDCRPRQVRLRGQLRRARTRRVRPGRGRRQRHPARRDPAR